MAEEPQPSTIREGASNPHAPTSTAEDRKAAAALSSLDAQEEEAVGNKEVDTKALGEAMKNLSVKSKDGPEKKAVKLQGADVELLIAELDIPKKKAEGLLRAHDGNAVKAMTAFVTSVY